jgi:preprotein translocase subunit SecB
METTTEQPAGIEFFIQKVFTKDLSFESPNTPVIFTKPWKPETTVALNTASQKLDDKNFEVTLTVTATTKSNTEAAYVAEVKQTGIFTISGAPENQLGHILGSFCPNTLFPYAREAISSLVTRGGFPELNLTPVNFDALYTQSLQQAQGQVKH